MDNQPLLDNSNNSYPQPSTVYATPDKSIPVAAPVVVPLDNGIPVAIAVYPNEVPQATPPVVAVVEDGCPPKAKENSQQIEVNLMDSATMDKEKLRSSLLRLISTNCCWGERAALNMEISEFVSIDSYHCQWTTFMERRWISITHRPFDNMAIDNKGIPPSMYDMIVPRPNYFEEKTVCYKIPYTEQVVNCSFCDGRGCIRCHYCKGERYENCINCWGSGWISRDEYHRYSRKCPECGGSGRCLCRDCHGDGVVRCSDCNATGREIQYQELNVKWTNYVDNMVLENSGLPKELVIGAGGYPKVELNGYHLSPPANIPYPDLQAACVSLFNSAEQRIQTNGEMLIQERVIIRAIPLVKAVGVYKSKKFDFWVYGTEEKCYAPNYPMTCCCGCNII